MACFSGNIISLIKTRTYLSLKLNVDFFVNVFRKNIEIL